MAMPAWIGLGSNLGDRRAILDAAVAALAEETPGVALLGVSSYHETWPVGGPPGQGPFLNAAAELETTLEPHQLLAVLQQIENQAGRVRTVRWGERTLDLDILIYASMFLDTRELRLPHPRLAFRRFVLVPLAEIAPNFVDPMTKRRVADLLANLDRKPRLVAIDGPRGARKEAVFSRLVEELPGFGISEADLGRPEEVEGEDALSGRQRRSYEHKGRGTQGQALGSRELSGCPGSWPTISSASTCSGPLLDELVEGTTAIRGRVQGPVRRPPGVEASDGSPVGTWPCRRRSSSSLPRIAEGPSRRLRDDPESLDYSGPTRTTPTRSK